MESIVPHIAYEHRLGQAKLYQQLRDRENLFHISSRLFKAYFRFSQHLAIALIEELEGFYEYPADDRQIPFFLKCLITLHFYATGSYQRSVKQITHISQSAVSKIIKEITEIILEISDKYIVFPRSTEERRVISASFEASGFPGVIGLVDGTQIAITGLKKEIEHHYVNRKGYHSINTQIICDHNCLLRNINPRYCGSTHDSFIWRSSLVFAMFFNEFQTADTQQYWLLGDSGYPLQPWLLTPYARPSNPQEEEFNRRHKQLRSTVERTIGIWKNRFRCVLGERKLRYSPTTSRKIIIATGTLHNFLILNKYNDEFSVTAFEPEPILTRRANVQLESGNQFLNNGKSVRNRVSATFL